jgi:hypothetical protein
MAPFESLRGGKDPNASFKAGATWRFREMAGGGGVGGWKHGDTLGLCGMARMV